MKIDAVLKTALADKTSNYRFIEVRVPGFKQYLEVLVEKDPFGRTKISNLLITLREPNRPPVIAISAGKSSTMPHFVEPSSSLTLKEAREMIEYVINLNFKRSLSTANATYIRQPAV